MKHAIRLLLAVFLLGNAAPSTLHAVEFSEATAVVRTATDTHPFTVELALTPQQHAQGLMNRRYLAPDRGMLFIFPQPKKVSMWMKNTFIPLDMLFLDERGIIRAIEQNAKPQSTSLIAPDNDAIAGVLEVPGGTVERLGIRVGDMVQSGRP